MEKVSVVGSMPPASICFSSVILSFHQVGSADLSSVNYVLGDMIQLHVAACWQVRE